MFDSPTSTQVRTRPMRVIPISADEDATTVIQRAPTSALATAVEASNMVDTLPETPREPSAEDLAADAANAHIASLAPAWFHLVNLLIRAGDSPACAVAFVDECMFGR